MSLADIYIIDMLNITNISIAVVNKTTLRNNGIFIGQNSWIYLILKVLPSKRKSWKPELASAIYHIHIWHFISQLFLINTESLILLGRELNHVRVIRMVIYSNLNKPHVFLKCTKTWSLLNLTLVSWIWEPKH